MDGASFWPLMGLHYLYPALAFTYYTIAGGVSVCTLQTLKASIEPKHKRVPRRAILNALLLILLSYLAQLTTVVIRSLVAKSWMGREDVVVGWLSCFMVYGVQLAGLAKTEHPVWYPLYGSWLFAIACETAMAGLYFVRNGQSLSGLPLVVHFALSTVRASLLLSIIVAYFSRRDGASSVQSADEERQSLLDSNGDAQTSEVPSNGSATARQNQDQNYGSTQESDAATKKRPNELPYERREREGREKLEKRLQEEGNWFTYIRKFLVSLTGKRKTGSGRAADQPVQKLTTSLAC